ncbi:MAG: HIT family protein [Anaerolineae bacterium]|nr:HIT family protein [Gemmatimonadaceae bacterium]
MGSGGCIFCRILAGEIPGTFIYRDEDCAAFMDIQPVNPGHLLVVPTRHVAYLAELDAPTAGRLMQIAQRAAAALRGSGLRCEGVNLFLADGEAAMQEVFHVHLHVFPRYAGDGFGMRFGPKYKELPSRDELELAAADIWRALGEIGTTAG